MVQGLFIPADSEQSLEVRELGDVDDYIKAVGGWIESIDVPPLDATSFVNDSGQVERLPFNPRATFLWWYEVPDVRHRMMLVGDAIMVGSYGPDGESTDIPSSTLALLTEKSPYAVVFRVDGSERWIKHRSRTRTSSKPSSGR